MNPRIFVARQGAFTMVELLIVIAVIGIMSALVISAFTGAAQDARRVIARQQQAAVQSAVNAWINSESAKPGVGLAGARTTYNNAENAKAKLTLVRTYLDDSTFDHLNSNSESTKIKSEALKKTGQYLAIENWADASYPKVELESN